MTAPRVRALLRRLLLLEAALLVFLLAFLFVELAATLLCYRPGEAPVPARTIQVAAVVLGLAAAVLATRGLRKAVPPVPVDEGLLIGAFLALVTGILAEFAWPLLCDAEELARLLADLHR